MSLSPSLASGPPLLETRDLWYRYPDGSPILQGINLRLLAGQWLALLGANGSGKTTLVKHFNGLLRPWRGKVLLEGADSAGRPVGELARRVAYLPQNPDRILFAPSVREEIAFGPRQQGLSEEDANGRAEECLALLGLGDVAQVPPAVLGYGMRRKVALASVLAVRPRLLVLDEPTTGLDAGFTEQIMRIVAERQCAGMAVLLVTHDLELAARYAERVVLLRAGRLLAEGTPADILTDDVLLEAACLLPLPVTRLAALLDARLARGFPGRFLLPDSLAAAYLARCGEGES